MQKSETATVLQIIDTITYLCQCFRRMKKIQKNGNKWKNTQSWKNAPSEQNKHKPIRRRRRKVPTGRKRNGQVKILVNDWSLVGPAEIFGQSHYPGNRIPGFKVLVVGDLTKAYRKIGAKKAVIYPVPSQVAA